MLNHMVGNQTASALLGGHGKANSYKVKCCDCPERKDVQIIVNCLQHHAIWQHS